MSRQLDAFSPRDLPGNNMSVDSVPLLDRRWKSLLGFPSMNDVYGRIRRTERKEPDGDWHLDSATAALAALDVSPRLSRPT